MRTKFYPVLVRDIRFSRVFELSLNTTSPCVPVYPSMTSKLFVFAPLRGLTLTHALTLIHSLSLTIPGPVYPHALVLSAAI